MFNYKKKSGNYYLEFKIRHGQSFKTIASCLGESPNFYFVGNDAGYSYYFGESTASFTIKIKGCTLETQIHKAQLFN